MKKEYSKTKFVWSGPGRLTKAMKMVNVTDKGNYTNFVLTTGWYNKKDKSFTPNKYNSRIEIPIMSPMQIDELAKALKELIDTPTQEFIKSSPKKAAEATN